MPNIYCPSCGTGTKYFFEKPIKCPSCSNAFAKVIVPKVSVSSFDDESEDEEKPQPSIHRKTKLDKNILKNIKVEVDEIELETFGQVFGSSPGEKRQKRRGVSKEEYKARIFDNNQTEIGSDD